MELSVINLGFVEHSMRPVFPVVCAKLSEFCVTGLASFVRTKEQYTCWNIDKCVI